jgi:hypothetical protein
MAGKKGWVKEVVREEVRQGKKKSQMSQVFTILSKFFP